MTPLVVDFLLGIFVTVVAWWVHLPSDPSPFGDHSIWKCSQCGEILAQEISIATWRWNGSSWEHQCENVQAGYSKARYFQEVK